MAVGEEEDGSIGFEAGVDDVLNAGGDLVDGLALRGAVLPKVPARAFGDEFGRETAFQRAVVPLREVGMDYGGIAIASDAAGLVGALEGARQDEAELAPIQESAQRLSLLDSAGQEG